MFSGHSRTPLSLSAAEGVKGCTAPDRIEGQALGFHWLLGPLRDCLFILTVVDKQHSLCHACG